jgi:polyferredoxin
MPVSSLLFSSLGLFLCTRAAAIKHDGGDGCARDCAQRPTLWYTICASDGIKTGQPEECQRCAGCPDVVSPKTREKHHVSPPHGFLINAGTGDEEVALLWRPRKPW